MSLRSPPSPSTVASPAIGIDVAGDVMEAFRVGYRDTAYFSVGREWTDYGPAYRCGLEAFAARLPGGGRFQDVEAELQRQWPRCCGESRLCWAEARDAIAHAWRTRAGAGAAAGDRRAGIAESDADN